MGLQLITTPLPGYKAALWRARLERLAAGDKTVAPAELFYSIQADAPAGLILLEPVNAAPYVVRVAADGSTGTLHRVEYRPSNSGTERMRARNEAQHVFDSLRTVAGRE